MKIFKPNFWNNKTLITNFLIPLSKIYEGIIYIREKLFIPKEFKIPIICVGNIYVGGTGKTPTTISLANELAKLKKKPVIIKKYYKNHIDEENLIKQYYPNLILTKNRREGIIEAINNKFDSAILDDGFQDYSIKKNFNIVCFHQNQLLGNGYLFPAGPLRESLKSLKRVDAVILNGKKDLRFEEKILRINNKIEFFYSKFKPTNLDEFKNKKLLAVAGIGNPDNFFKLLIDSGLKIEKKISFPDHYNFSKPEILRMIQDAQKDKLQLIMTEKDYLRIKKNKFPEIKYLKIELIIEKLDRLLLKIKKLYD